MKVYLVYSGRYDDHGLDAVFSTEELAQEYINQGKPEYEDAYIRPWEVDNPPIKEKEPEPIYTAIQYFPDGNRWMVTSGGKLSRGEETRKVKHVHKTPHNQEYYYIVYNNGDINAAIEDGKMDITQAIEEGWCND